MRRRRTPTSSDGAAGGGFAPGSRAIAEVLMLSTLLSIAAPWRVTSWTRAKRRGAVFLDALCSTRFTRNDP